MDTICSIDKFRVPVGNQEIELQQITYEAGGIPQLRVRIRERSRFTVFDIDPQTAEHWGRAMSNWAQFGLVVEPVPSAGGAAVSVHSECQVSAK